MLFVASSLDPANRRDRLRLFNLSKVKAMNRKEINSAKSELRPFVRSFLTISIPGFGCGLSVEYNDGHSATFHDSHEVEQKVAEMTERKELYWFHTATLEEINDELASGGMPSNETNIDDARKSLRALFAEMGLAK